MEGRRERAEELLSEREGSTESPSPKGRRNQPRRKWAIIGLESALPRAPSVGGFGSLPMAPCLPSPL